MEPFFPFVLPKLVRLPIGPPGHFIQIHDRLNAGEMEELHSKWQPLIKSGQGVELVTRQIRFAKVAAYLDSWSFTEPNGDPLKYEGISSLENLDPRTFTEIHRLIEAHETKRDAEVAAMKADPPGATESSATSPSVARWEAGVTTG